MHNCVTAAITGFKKKMRNSCANAALQLFIKSWFIRRVQDKDMDQNNCF